jgi:hypothetical protein
MNLDLNWTASWNNLMIIKSEAGPKGLRDLEKNNEGPK